MDFKDCVLPLLLAVVMTDHVLGRSLTYPTVNIFCPLLDEKLDNQDSVIFKKVVQLNSEKYANCL